MPSKARRVPLGSVRIERRTVRMRGATLVAMALIAVGGDFGEPMGVTGCWCCGDRTVQASLVRLGEHPEVGVCFRCVGVLVRRKREIKRCTRAAPVGWPLWRRVLFRLGYSRC